jgi:hypothetical protein
MTIVELVKLGKCPDWLRLAETKEANVEIDVWNRVVWLGGDWLGGVWLGGDWHGGDWLGGDWHGGDWLGGVWLGGVWHGGRVGFEAANRKEARRVHTLAHCEGYPKTLCDIDGVAYILAGCHLFTLAEAFDHWRDRKDRVITYAMLTGIAEVAKQWGLSDGAKPHKGAV